MFINCYYYCCLLNMLFIIVLLFTVLFYCCLLLYSVLLSWYNIMICFGLINLSTGFLAPKIPYCDHGYFATGASDR